MKYRAWTTKELFYLKRNYRKMMPSEIAEKLGRTEEAIKTKAKKVGLRKRTTLYRAVKNGEIIALGTANELAKRLNLSKKTIHTYATPLHLKSAASLKVEKIGVCED